MNKEARVERQRRDTALNLFKAQVESTDTLVLMRSGARVKVLQFDVKQERTEITELVGLAFELQMEGSSLIIDAWDLFQAIHTVRSVGYDRVVIGDADAKNEQVYRTFYRLPIRKAV